MNAPVPPEAAIVAAPLLPALQETFVCETVFTTIAVGCVIVNVLLAEHAFASVTVQVYVPAIKPEAVIPVPPNGVQLYVNAPVPPEADIVAAPLLPALQETFVCETAFTTITDGCVIVNVLDAAQPFASVTVQVHDPALSPETLAVPSPVGFPGVQL